MSVYTDALITAFHIGWVESKDPEHVVVQRDDLLALAPRANLGDIIYTYRYRRDLPPEICSRAPEGKVWLIKGAGDGIYVFKAVAESRMQPDPTIIPETFTDLSHPVVRRCRKNDEQGILALIDQNDLLSRFFGFPVKRVQSHLRTKLKGIGQVEIDDLYAGEDADGRCVIVPVQAKGAKDRPGPAQALQDMAFCAAHYPGDRCRPLSIHYDPRTRRIAMMELEAEGDVVRVVAEQHFRAIGF